MVEEDPFILPVSLSPNSNPPEELILKKDNSRMSNTEVIHKFKALSKYILQC